MELFPDFDLDLVTISVPYPGAAPLEVEDGICKQIEEKIWDLDGIKEMTSFARENVGVVSSPHPHFPGQMMSFPLFHPSPKSSLRSVYKYHLPLPMVLLPGRGQKW